MNGVDVLNWLDFDARRVDLAFMDIEATFADLDMKEDADEVISMMPTKCNENFDWTDPTKSIIENMQILAIGLILKRYPNASVNRVRTFSDMRLDVELPEVVAE